MTFSSESVFDLLDPQTGTTKEAGITFIRNNVEFDLAYYTSKYVNEIHYDSLTFQNVNLDDTKREGGIIGLTYVPKDTLKINMNSTYTKATFENGPFEGKTVPIVPRQQHNLSIYWEFRNNYSLSSSSYYVGRKYFDNDQLNTAQQIPSYTTTDIKLAWKKNAFNYSLAIYNVFDKESLFDYGVKSTSNDDIYNGYTLATRSAEISAAYTY